jgi:hypothetical protein
MIVNKDRQVNWQIFTLYKVNINYDLSHKLNDVGECQNEFPTEIEIRVGIPHTYEHTNIVHND